MKLTHPALTAADGISHGFFTRQGGVSGGIYASLNCGVGSRDEPAAVRENRTRVAAALGAPATEPATPYQVHGTAVTVAEAAWSSDDRPRADAIVADRPGVAIAVGTADCGPVLLADPHARVIGAAHAGWRGAVAGVTEAAVAAMEDLGADRTRIVAVLGPAISQPNYEVGEDMRVAVLDADPSATDRFVASDRDDRYRFDLPGYIVSRLGRAGVHQVAALDRCTYAEPELFFSYRRATHRGEPDYGRMLAGIALAP